MTEFQAALLIGQLSRLEQQMAVREKNARLLNELLQDVDGVSPLATDPQVTRHAYHLYIFKLHKDLADKLNKSDVCRMLNAEGIPVHEGYVALNQNRAISEEIRKRTGQARRDSCPVAERACEKEALWLPQNVLLGDEQDMHDIAQAIRKVVQSV